MAVHRSSHRKTHRYIFGKRSEGYLIPNACELEDILHREVTRLVNTMFLAQFLLDKDQDSTFDAGWAVDDVRLLDCALPTKNDCEEPEIEFQCPSGGCILLDSVCDLTDDCGDGSDEADCCGEAGCYLQTDFESEDYPLGDWEIVEVEGR